MGVNGCGWMRWVTEDTGSTKTIQPGVIKGPTDQDLGPMDGEISPDIMFCVVCQKTVWVGADVYISVWLGKDGCMDTDGSTKKTKRATNEQGIHVFAMHAHNEKTQEMCRDDYGD